MTIESGHTVKLSYAPPLISRTLKVEITIPSIQTLIGFYCKSLKIVTLLLMIKLKLAYSHKILSNFQFKILNLNLYLHRLGFENTYPIFDECDTTSKNYEKNGYESFVKITATVKVYFQICFCLLLFADLILGIACNYQLYRIEL